MRVLTLKDPWATMIPMQVKKYETRSWYTSYRGSLLIHSSKAFEREDIEVAMTPPFKRYIAKRYKTLGDMPRGCIIGKCNLVNVIMITSIYFFPPRSELPYGDFSMGRCAWVLEDAEWLPEPIPARGQLGLWDFDMEEAKP